MRIKAQAKVHCRIAKVGGFVIDQREAVRMNEHVLWRVVAVTKGSRLRQHAFDDRLNSGGDFGPALLDAAIERLDAQLHEHGRVVERFGELASRGVVHLAEHRSNLFGDCDIGVSFEQKMFPDVRSASAWLMAKT